MPLRDYEEEERLAREEATTAAATAQPLSPSPEKESDATAATAATTPRQQPRQRRQQQQTKPDDESAAWNAEFFGGDVGELQRTLDAKTDEFNALRQKLMRPVVYDDGVAKAQKTFETLTKQIDRLRCLKQEMNGGREAYGQEDIEALIDGVLQKNHSLLSPVDGGGGGESASPPPRKRSRCDGEGAREAQRRLEEAEAEEEARRQQTRKLRLKNVSDKDKRVKLLPLRVFGPRNADRRIKHTRAADERTVRDVVAAAMSAASVSSSGCGGGGGKDGDAPTPPDGDAPIALDPAGGTSTTAADAREGDVACAACGAGCFVDDQGWRFVCPRCGMVQDKTLTDADAGGAELVTTRYGTSARRPKGSSYKTLGHFTEITHQLQGKRKAKAPREVREACRDFCVRNGVKRNDIDEGVIRKCLKKYNRGGQYYKYAMEIACELRGVPLPCMTEMQEAILTHLYPLAVHAYHSSPRYIKRMNNRVGRIKDRPNNMIGNYVLYKLCELCGFTDFLPYIRLSKNVDNVRENDESWKHVCCINRWKFYTTKFYSSLRPRVPVKARRPRPPPLAERRPCARSTSRIRCRRCRFRGSCRARRNRGRSTARTCGNGLRPAKCSTARCTRDSNTLSSRSVLLLPSVALCLGVCWGGGVALGVAIRLFARKIRRQHGEVVNPDHSSWSLPCSRRFESCCCQNVLFLKGGISRPWRRRRTSDVTRDVTPFPLTLRDPQSMRGCGA